MDTLYNEIELQDCPLCHGPAFIEEENGWCIYVTCGDCGGHTANIEYKTPADRLAAAQAAAHLWNIGKVLSCNPGE